MQHLGYHFKLLFIGAIKGNYWLKECYLAFRKSFLGKFLVHILQANLVEFVYCYGNVNNLFLGSNHLGNA